ncbi:hypothetical protein [uncultured Pseudomonas sp.]|uniref:hypothetical protein n=1 Tax=uncultured Pseudomonas sp. TaxID=114707 RepID=UPI0025D9422E|nr:hypothetical protein [uncultured Pseudomonas sp.]
MNCKIQFLAIALLLALSCNAQETKNIEKKAFPYEIINKIAAYENIPNNEISSLKDGVLNWGRSNYLGALTNKLQNECRIYIYSEEKGLAPLAMYPDCKFIGKVNISNARNKKMPDIIFKMLLSSGNTPDPVEHYVVAVFDDQKEEYCESQSIAAWYQIGILSNTPENFDMACPY